MLQEQVFVNKVPPCSCGVLIYLCVIRLNHSITIHPALMHVVIIYLKHSGNYSVIVETIFLQKC